MKQSSLLGLLTVPLLFPATMAAQDGEETLRRAAGAMSALRAAGAEQAPAWVGLEVEVSERYPEGPGPALLAWTGRYRQTGVWTFLRRGGARYDVIPGTVSNPRPPSLTAVYGSGNEVCVDGHEREWNSPYDGPVEVQPALLGASGETGALRLWYGVPTFHMRHPGHNPSSGECYTTDAHRIPLELGYAELEYAGFEVNDHGEFLVGQARWEDLVAAASGDGPPVRIDADYAAGGITYRVRGTIGAVRVPDYCPEARPIELDVAAAAGMPRVLEDGSIGTFGHAEASRLAAELARPEEICPLALTSTYEQGGQEAMALFLEGDPGGARQRAERLVYELAARPASRQAIRDLMSADALLQLMGGESAHAMYDATVMFREIVAVERVGADIEKLLQLSGEAVLLGLEELGEELWWEVTDLRDQEIEEAFRDATPCDVERLDHAYARYLTLGGENEHYHDAFTELVEQAAEWRKSSEYATRCELLVV